MRKLILALALASASVPVFADTGFDFDTAKQGVTDRYSRGVITKQRDDELVTVTVTPTGEQWGRFIFSVAVFNKAGQPITVGSESITAQLPDGTTVASLPEHEVLKIANSRANWAKFGAAMAGAMASANSYGSYSGSTYGSGSGNVYGYGGYGRYTYSGSSYTSGTYYDPTAAAIKQQQTTYQINNIQAGLDNLVANVGNTYFETTTIDPGTGFAGQVMIDKLKFRRAGGDSAKRKEFIVVVTLNGRPYQFPFHVEG
ncbi:hypothetical protein LZ518_08520 [Sphingomonas sp. RB56-2]|uniref:Uncharacterized protein n=1 Tax=Sphingomonas brevis TaxID=2908206 RepID=A0ABT0S9X9_9SPHN|nr:hypothetical protein [Sphingomonas brevis]MCL6741173.1 hypothetical protein [Sphingomonas brevis]